MGFIVGDTANIASRMRKWEPVRFGPELTNITLDNVENWAEFEKQAPKYLKNGKDITGKVAKKIGKCGKLGIVVSLLTFAAASTFGAKNSFGTLA